MTALYSLSRNMLRPETSSDQILILADALDEAAAHMPAAEAEAYRREARFLREAAPRYAHPASHVAWEAVR